MGHIKTIDGAVMEVKETYDELNSLLDDCRVGWVIVHVVSKEYHDHPNPIYTKHKINIETLIFIS